MNDFEDRIRRELRSNLGAVDTEGVLGDVVRGVARRRRQRVALAVAATVLLVAGTVGTVAALAGDGRDRADPIVPPPTLTQPPLPEGAAQGVIDVSAPSSEEVFRLTTNVGCTACSTVWRQDPSADGGWKRLHDFGADAYVGRANPVYGPVTNFAMAADGRNGWAWGGRLFSTHDSGETWAAVTTGPGRKNTESGHQVGTTDQYAWSLLRTDRGTELWRTTLGSDSWTLADAPSMGGVSGMITIGRHVALETSDEGLAGPRLLYSPDGNSWGEVANPCSGDRPVLVAFSVAFMLCPSSNSSATAIHVLIGPEHQVLDLDHWGLFRSIPADTRYSAFPLGDDRVLVVAPNRRATLVLSDGASRPVDLGLQPGEELFAPTAPGFPSMLLTSSYRLLVSPDAGLTWRQAD